MKGKRMKRIILQSSENFKQVCCMFGTSVQVPAGGPHESRTTQECQILSSRSSSATIRSAA